jgi:hypothetical protein
MHGLNRRDALIKLAAGGIGAATSDVWVAKLGALAQAQAAHVHASAAQATPAWVPKTLTARQLQTVAGLCELIIPATDTPGAKAALVDRFVDGVLHDAEPADRAKFLAGLAWIDKTSRARYKADFLSATPAQQTELLTRLSSEQDEKTGVEFFQALKSMTITGYYTTEIGLRQELGDSGQLFSGAFEGCTHPEDQ